MKLHHEEQIVSLEVNSVYQHTLEEFKDNTDRWLRLNGPVNFSYFYSKCYLKLVLWTGTRKIGVHCFGAKHA